MKLNCPKGQVLIEYLILLAFTILLLSSFTSFAHRSIRAVWKQMTKEIVAGCPGSSKRSEDIGASCKPPPNFIGFPP